MKVLYIAHYREDSGWGEAARNYILALDKVGVDVVCRPVIFKNNAQLSDRIKELESKSDVDCDVCIQNILPHYMVKTSRYKKNIGQFVTETLGIKHTSWYNHLRMMDELWVPNKDMYGAFANFSRKLIPHCFDTSIYDEEYIPLDIPHTKGKYVFYFIGEFNRRKNIGAILRAFHSSFHRNDGACLVLKLNKPGVSANELANNVDAMATEIKKHLGMYADLNMYSKEILVPHKISRADILRLHSTGNCFVSVSFGEAWSIPAFEAHALGNKCIVPNYSPFTDYIDDGLFVDTTIQQLVGAEKTFTGFGSAREKWYVPNVATLAEHMRTAFMTKRERVYPSLCTYSLENVGKMMLEAIND